MFIRYLFSTFLIVFVVFCISFNILALPRDEKTVLYMSFDKEPKGDTVQDESGYGNDGKIIGNGVKWTKNGKYGGALEFDGTSKIEIPHSESLNLNKEITLEAWFKTKVPQKGRFFVYKIHIGAGRNYEWGIYLTSDSTATSMYVVKPNDEVGFVSVAGDYKDDSWHFLAGTYDGKSVKCFTDGTLQSSDWSGDIRTSEGAVVIGTWGTNFFSGTLDEVRICNVALKPDQLQLDFERGYRILAVNSTGKLSTTWASIKKMSD